MGEAIGFKPARILTSGPLTTTNGSILITTRSRHVANSLAGKDVIELLALSRDEAAEMFTKRLETPHLAAERDARSTLLEKLADLPLAIVQAASFINMTQWPVQTYLELLDTCEVGVIKLLSKYFGDPSRYPNSINPVANTWLISFERIRKYNPLAAAFLSSMACLHEKGIPRSLLPDASSEIDEVDIIDAVAVLTGYSFVTRQAGCGITNVGELYDLHRLVQLAARSWLKMEGLLLGRTKVCITHVAQLFPTRDHEHKSTWALYLPQLSVYMRTALLRRFLSDMICWRRWVYVWPSTESIANP
jgi:hypothetical protein